MVASKYEFFDDTPNSYGSFRGDRKRGQSFTVGSVGTNEDFIIDHVSIYFGPSSGSPAEAFFYIYAADGEGKPTGSILSSGSKNSGGLSAGWEDVSMSSYTLQASTQYVLVAYSPDSDTSNYRSWGQLSTGGYSGGTSLYSNGTWNVETNVDKDFEIWGTTSTSSGTNTQINIGDAWKSVDAMKINIGDSWKDVAGAKINIGDAWKTIF